MDWKNTDYSNNENKSMGSSLIHNNLLLLLPILFLAYKKIPQLIKLRDINESNLEKKVKLLNRIKGYMNEEEQSIIHRAEMILHIITKVKSLLELSNIQKIETKHHSLSYDDRKKNMLMDIAEFVDEDKREAIHKAIDMNVKASIMGSKLKEIKEANTYGITIESLEKYIELFEPILEGEYSSKSKELKLITGIIKMIKTMEKKESIDEEDIFNLIKPLVNDEQVEGLTKMMQIFKVMKVITSESVNNNSLEANNLNGLSEHTEEITAANSMDSMEALPPTEY